MIQRIQSLYLVLCVGLLAWFMFSRLAAESGGDWQSYLVYALGLGSAGLVLAVLLSFRCRDKQRKLASLALAELVVFCAAVYGFLYFAGNLDFRTSGGVDLVRIWQLALPALSYVCLRLAVAGIKRDIELVQSVSRLR